jgi:hypothetical protein
MNRLNHRDLIERRTPGPSIEYFKDTMASERASQQAFFGVSALLFAASAAATIVWCASTSAMGEMPMTGGWTMSMAWIRMPGQTWPGAAASFLGRWVVMMVWNFSTIQS